ncbi:MAG: hypothetical protein ACUVSD_09605 [Thiobacillaceae bacterium]
MQLNTPLKTLTLALAAGLAAAPAFAVSNPESVAGVQKIVMSGATAPDGFIKSAVEEMLKPGFFTYRNNDLSQAFQHRAWYGLAKAGIPGVAENTPILVVKRSKGGSVWGVDPVARASRIESLDFSTCTTGGSADGTSYSYFCGTKGLDPDSPDFTNPSLNNGVVSDMGVSDVPPAMFKGPYNVEFGQTELSNAEAAVLAVKPVNSLMMGFAVTNDVPLTTRITRSNYGNMLMGYIQDWTQIDANLTGNTQVVVCRRVDGSGTQASYNWYFNNFPCTTAFNGAVKPASMQANSISGIVSGTGTQDDPYVIDPTAGYTVVNNSTSGDVRNCLKNAQNHADHKIKGDDGNWYLIQFSNSSEPFKAIGVLSLDSYGAENGWSFRMMDGAGSFVPATQTASVGATGIAPSKAELLAGAWDFAVELTMQYRNQTVVNPQGDSVAPLSGVKKSFADELIKRSGDPAKIALNSKKNAYAAVPDYYDPFANPTNEAHVALGSRGGNMCQPLQRKY